MPRKKPSESAPFPAATTEVIIPCQLATSGRFERGLIVADDAVIGADTVARGGQIGMRVNPESRKAMVTPRPINFSLTPRRKGVGSTRPPCSKMAASVESCTRARSNIRTQRGHICATRLLACALAAIRCRQLVGQLRDRREALARLAPAHGAHVVSGGDAVVKLGRLYGGVL